VSYRFVTRECKALESLEDVQVPMAAVLTVDFGVTRHKLKVTMPHVSQARNLLLLAYCIQPWLKYCLHQLPNVRGQTHLVNIFDCTVQLENAVRHVRSLSFRGLNI